MKPKTDKRSQLNTGNHVNFLVPEIENYTCGNCRETVSGGRYNNHCPHCLWSRHLDDKLPGDRASTCQALMEPVGVTQKRGKWRIVHQCTGCEEHTVIDSAAEDNLDLITKLSQLPLPALARGRGRSLKDTPSRILLEGSSLGSKRELLEELGLSQIAAFTKKNNLTPDALQILRTLKYF